MTLLVNVMFIQVEFFSLGIGVLQQLQSSNQALLATFFRSPVLQAVLTDVSVLSLLPMFSAPMAISNCGIVLCYAHLMLQFANSFSYISDIGSSSNLSFRSVSFFYCSTTCDFDPKNWRHRWRTQ